MTVATKKKNIEALALLATIPALTGDGNKFERGKEFLETAIRVGSRAAGAGSTALTPWIVRQGRRGECSPRRPDGKDDTDC